MSKNNRHKGKFVNTEPVVKKEHLVHSVESDNKIVKVIEPVDSKEASTDDEEKPVVMVLDSLESDTEEETVDGVKEEAVEDKEEAVEDKEEAVEDKEEAVEDKEETTEDKEEAVEDKEDTDVKEEAVEDKEEAVEDKEEAVEDKEEAVEDKEEAVEDKEEAVEDKEEAVEDKEETPVEKETDVEKYTTVDQDIVAAGSVYKKKEDESNGAFIDRILAPDTSSEDDKYAKIIEENSVISAESASKFNELINEDKKDDTADSEDTSDYKDEPDSSESSTSSDEITIISDDEQTEDSSTSETKSDLTKSEKNYVNKVIKDYDDSKSGTKKKASKGEIKIFIILAAIVIAVVAGAYLLNKFSNKGTDSTLDTYRYQHTILTGDKLNSAASTITQKIAVVTNGPSYVLSTIGVSENDYDVYIYNKGGECFAQTADASYTAIYRNDGKAIRYNATDGLVTFGSDMDILTAAKNAVLATQNKVPGAKLLEMTSDVVSDDASNETHEYRVDLDGEAAVKSIYEPAGKDFANDMLAKMKKKEGSSWNPHVIYIFIVSNGGDISIQCNIVEKDSDNEDREFINWTVNGYLELDNWNLDKAWYTYDFENADSDEVANLVNTLMNQMSLTLQNYAADNNISVSTSISDNDADSTDSSTEESTEASTDSIVDEIQQSGISENTISDNEVTDISSDDIIGDSTSSN